jgi:hypothetical protein
MKSSFKRWLRKRQVRERYGEVTDRTVERAVKDGRSPRRSRRGEPRSSSVATAAVMQMIP